MPLTIQTSLNLLDAQLCAPKIAQVQQQQTKREREVKAQGVPTINIKVFKGFSFHSKCLAG